MVMGGIGNSLLGIGMYLDYQDWVQTKVTCPVDISSFGNRFCIKLK